MASKKNPERSRAITPIPDPANARRHDERNRAVIRHSLEELGAGRSILLDGDNTIVAGNGVYEQAAALGLKIKVVDAAPDELVAVRRADLKGDRARRMALVDNRATELSDWDTDAIASLAKDSESLLDGLWTSHELERLLTRSGYMPTGVTSIISAARATCPLYEPPFQWFGGKSRVAPLVWAALGDVENYVEPFFGSGAVLFRRPHFDGQRIETVNDLDCMVCNFWRALKADHEAVAKHADWPIIESDLHARHAWLIRQKESLQASLEGDPDFFDVKVAGWWVWGQCAWIGSGWCCGWGPWRVEAGKLVKSDKAVRDGMRRARPHLINGGRGVNRNRPHLINAGRGVNRKRPQLSDAGDLCELYSQSLSDYLRGLAGRLRRVRVCCGDWSRVVTDSVTVKHGVTGVFLDPPYSQDERDPGVYSCDSVGISDVVRNWCLERADDPRFRIVLCGYDGEHEMPDSWRKIGWKATGGMANDGGGATRGIDNAWRERLWLSPHCFDVTGHPEAVAGNEA